MEKTEFIEMLKEEASNLGEVIVQTIVKPSGSYTGLYIRKDGEPTPVVNLDELYNEYEKDELFPEESVENMMKILNFTPEPSFNVNDITDWSKMRSKLIIRMFDTNPGGLYDEFEGTFFCPYIEVSDTAGIRVTEQLIDCWDVDFEVVTRVAAENTAIKMILGGNKE